MIPLILFFTFLILFKKEYNRIESLLQSDKIPEYMRAKYGPFDTDNVTAILIAYLVLGILMLIASMFCTYSGITHLVAPEWYAIKDIVELVK